MYPNNDTLGERIKLYHGQRVPDLPGEGMFVVLADRRGYGAQCDVIAG
jgi:hypothetical protein